MDKLEHTLRVATIDHAGQIEPAPNRTTFTCFWAVEPYPLAQHDVSFT